jgi:membrane protein DedA with SNARE-associated domain
MLNIDFNGAIFENIRQHGTISVIAGGLIEQVIVPIPSPIIPMAAGFLLVNQGVFSFSIVKEIFLKAALPFAIGSTIGSSMVYLIAWFGGKWMINKFSKWFSFTWEDVEKFQKKYFTGKSTDELLIFVFRAIPIMPSVLISAVCGAVRIRPWSYYFWTFIGLFIRGIILGFVGWKSGDAIFKISSGLDRWEMVFSIIILAVFAGVFFWAYKGRKKWLQKIGIE